MKRRMCCLALGVIFTTSCEVQAVESPVRFVRSGQKATIGLFRSDIRAMEPLALVAYGRPLKVPVTSHDGCVEFIAPEVRVPIVFQLVAGPNATVYYDSLVVYPNRPAPWSEDLQLVTVGPPHWFDQWAEAVGLPVTKLRDPAMLGARNWRNPRKSVLLVVKNEYGTDTNLKTVVRLAAEHRVNVLALGADWFAVNESVRRNVAILPKHLVGPLYDLQNEDWPRPPMFEQRVLEIVNRRTWIMGRQHPLVEEIRSVDKEYANLIIVISYLPWQEQLGRCEMADVLFARVLGDAVMGAEGRTALDGRWQLLYPNAKDVNPEERPVLAAALPSLAPDGTDPTQIGAYVLDLRGKPSLPSDYFDGAGAVKTVEAWIGVRSPLLILGDDPVLDAWEWLGLDRGGARTSRPGVFWWPDNALPPSVESQLRLMQLFTEWNISLGANPREASHEFVGNEF